MTKDIKLYSLLCALNATFMLNTAFSTTDVSLSNEMRSASTSTSNIIFSDIDQQLDAIYPETLTGANEIDLSVIQYRSALSSKKIAASNQELGGCKKYYNKQLFIFLSLIKSNKSLTEEQRLIWQNIWDDAEAQESSKVIIEQTFIRTYINILRAAILASDHISEDALVFLRSVPNMGILFASLLDIPSTVGGEKIPAWKHSAEACLLNMLDKEVESSSVPKKVYYDRTYVSSDCIKQIAEEMNRLGLPKNNILTLMPGAGKIGLTAILKLWLNNIAPVPLTLGEYKAHGLSLSSAVAAMHDFGHSVVDNRFEAVLKSILHHLKTAFNNGHLVDDHLSFITEKMVGRYTTFNQVLLNYIEKKEVALINEFNAADLLENEEDQKQDKIQAKKKYNKGIGALFTILHEEYLMNESVLISPTFEESLNRLTAAPITPGVHPLQQEPTTTLSPVIDALTTFLNPQSTLTDAEIYEVIRAKKKSAIVSFTNLDIPYNPDVQNPETIGDLERLGYIAFSGIKRSAVLTEISLRTRMGNSNIKVMKLPTTDYLLNTAKETNAILALAGMNVKEDEPSVVKTMLETARISKEEALEKVNTWYNAIKERSRQLVQSFKDDMLSTLSSTEIQDYDSYLTAQELEINERIK